MFHQVVDDYDGLVASIEKLDVNERHDLVHIKARLVLVDGSGLHVSEVWIDSSLEKYSYYWLEETGETIVGWDNAPHHEEVETFPYHEHRKDEILPSDPMSAERVLAFLEEKLL
jgi:hypothetical protein